MTTSRSAAELVHLVTAIPGVRGIQPGLTSTLKVIGKHMQQQESQHDRFGVVIEEGTNRAIIEVGLDGSRPVKDIVRDIQETVIRSLTEPNTRDVEAVSDEDSEHIDNPTRHQVIVRVQSLL